METLIRYIRSAFISARHTQFRLLERGLKLCICAGFLLIANGIGKPEIAFAAPANKSAHPAHRATFSIQFDGLSTDLSIISTQIMPGQILRVSSPSDQAITLHYKDELISGDNQWTWTAPRSHGHHTLEFSGQGTTIQLNVFVLKPVDTAKHTKIGDFRLGNYVQIAFRGKETYQPPTGFIELKPDMHDIQITPHFTLGQFKCKQQPKLEPKYLLISPVALIKLERLLEAANAAGHSAQSFFVMSGYRSPWYNSVIGNTTRVSRHLYGDGMDIYIDENHDGMMDDLNGDGKINIFDAKVLAALAENLAKANDPDWRAGGISAYKGNAAHGPFVHIDARGQAARW